MARIVRVKTAIVKPKSGILFVVHIMVTTYFRNVRL